MTTCDHGQPRLVTSDSKFRVESESRDSTLASLYHALMRSTGEVLHEHGYAVFQAARATALSLAVVGSKGICVVFGRRTRDQRFFTLVETGAPPVITRENIRPKFVKTSSENVESVLARSARIRYKSSYVRRAAAVEARCRKNASP